MKPINQTLLTVIIAFTMIMGFIGVYAVGYTYENYETTNSIVVWESDSNMEFQSLVHEHTDDTYKNLPNPYGVGTIKQTIVGGVSFYEFNNCTPVFTGNNTWAMTMTGFIADVPDYDHAFHHIPILIPEAKTFLADEVHITMTLPGDLGQTMTIYLGSNNNPELDDLPDVDFTVLLPATNLFGETEYDQTFSLTSFQKLEWYGESQNKDEPGIWFYIENTNTLGLSSVAMEISITITGVPITTWSLMDSINTVIGASIIGNVIIGTFMIDSIDFGKAIRDLPRKYRTQSASKGGKK